MLTTGVSGMAVNRLSVIPGRPRLETRNGLFATVGVGRVSVRRLARWQLPAIAHQFLQPLAVESPLRRGPYLRSAPRRSPKRVQVI